MPDRGYEHRRKWNAANYKQLNVALPPDLAEAFKVACEANGEPVRHVLIGLIEEYTQKPPNALKTPGNAPNDYFSTRGRRKKAAQEMLRRLETLRDAEDAYMDSIPESMYNRRESAENAVASLEEAIATLEDLYS